MQASRFAAILVLFSALGGASHVLGQNSQSVIPYIPEKESPFFVLNDTQENPGANARKALIGPQNDYPRNKGSEQSAGQMFSTFFTGMFSSVRLGPKNTSGSKLAVEPAAFSLDDRREITATFVVENRTARLLKLDFPTSQRIEILVRDNNGKVIEKWSDDRAFRDESGVVMINPGEHIQYEEKIATRDMQPGRTYTIEASLANNPEFTKTAFVTPSGKPRAAQPNPALQSTPPAGAKPDAKPAASEL
jgi:hypothetical protein